MSGLERISWKQLEPEFLEKWGWPGDGKKFQAEHVAIVGPTGSGKSKFTNHIVKKRSEVRGSNVYILATKPADDEMQDLHWPIVRKWPPPYGKHEQVIFWPEPGKPAAGVAPMQLAVFKFLNEVFTKDANFILVFDEIAYVEKELGLQKITDRYWREARSLGITMIAGTQRPRNVSRHMWSQPSWSIAFRPDDEDDAVRTAEIIGGRNLYRHELMKLERYEFIIVERRERRAYISKLGT